MTIDNRTNHFTDEQVIAAAMVIDRNAFRVGEAESNAWETGRDFPSELSAAKQRIRTRKYRAKKNARAALVAAAGVAPVQPSSTVDEAALIREAKAEAWDEGYQEANQDLWRDGGREGNPYREGSET